MRKPIYLALVSSLVFQACSKSSDDSGTPDGALSPIAANYDKAPTAREGTMTQTQAVEFKTSQGEDFVVDVMADFDETQASEPSATTTLRALGLKAPYSLEEGTDAEACAGTITEGDETDADADGVFDNMTRTVDCTMPDPYNMAIKGTVKWKDKDLDKKPGGFTLSFAPFTMTMKMTAEGQTFDHVMHTAGTVDATRDGTTMSAKTDLGTAAVITTTESVTTVVAGRFLEQSFVTTDAGESAETFFANGTLNLSGFVRYGVDTQRTTSLVGEEAGSETGDAAFNVSFVLEVKGTDLVRSSDCANGFKSGEFTFTDGADNVMKATFAECVATWTYNDTAI